MPSLQLNDEEVAAFLYALDEIHEIRELNLLEDDDLRYALANLVGLLKDTLVSLPITKTGEVPGRVDLEALFAEKFEAWDSARNTDSDRRSADSHLEFFLANSGRITANFVTGTGPYGSVSSFRYALDHEQAWRKYELQLCASSQHELEELTVVDIAHSLVLYAY